MKSQKIKLRILTVASVILAVPFMNMGFALADTPPATPPPGSTAAQRLDQRKKERNIQLDAATTKRLTSLCVSGQTTVRAMQQKLTPVFTDRAKTYKSIDAKLWVSIGELKLADKDTFELEKKRTALAEQMVLFQTTAANFQQTLDDMVVINCEADVVGFKALLDTARLYLAQLRDQSAAINKNVVDVIKPALNTFVTDLQPKTNTEVTN